MTTGDLLNHITLALVAGAAVQPSMIFELVNRCKLQLRMIDEMAEELDSMPSKPSSKPVAVLVPKPDEVSSAAS